MVTELPKSATLYSVEPRVPIPPARGRGSLYPFLSMEVGESFFVPTLRYSLRRNAYNHGIRYGRHFTCRLVAEGGVKGTRVWRTK